jgi:hypothetical protein
MPEATDRGFVLLNRLVVLQEIGREYFECE